MSDTEEINEVEWWKQEAELQRKCKIAAHDRLNDAYEEILKLQKTNDLLEELESARGFILIERTWKSEHLGQPRNKLVWKCQCGAPAIFRAEGNTVNEAIRAALDKQKEILSKAK